MQTYLKRLNKKGFLTGALIFFFGIYLGTVFPTRYIQKLYQGGGSVIIQDRYGELIQIQPNAKGYYARGAEDVPERLKKLLIKKEDHFFYYHLGINPLSIIRDIAGYFSSGKLNGSSTLTQQLVKNLLGNETDRTLKNKIVETFYSFGLELHASKKDILKMYLDTAYFGNQIQGIEEASRFYFSKPAAALNEVEILELLVTLNSPSSRYPGTSANKKILNRLAAILEVETSKYQRALGVYPAGSPSSFGDVETRFWRLTSSGVNRGPGEEMKSDAAFEVSTLGVTCKKACETTLDLKITASLRKVLKRNLSLPSFYTVKNGAMVVIKLPENELLAIVGSPNPNSLDSGYQINMAIEPRPIGSTAKPFIYLTAFEKGARPYSVVEDREYKYEIGTGFAFYPKNYDGKYRGEVTLHQALSNSLNVPSVKVLEFVTLEKFYQFLRDRLGFKPIQPLENYELGIALGSLEMDLLTLANYFTIFPNEGMLKPLKILKEEAETDIQLPPMGYKNSREKKISDKNFIQLINKLLSDRETAVEQFGIKSSLNLEAKNYALKTGTSRDFHDSWTIGYTPDFLVGVWIGNSDNTPLKQVSGQTGAGKIWHEAMDILLNSSYNKKTPFSFDALKEFKESGSIEYGLREDNYLENKFLLKPKDSKLIFQPHHGDTFLFEEKMTINLVSRTKIQWYLNDVFLEERKEVAWHPLKSGKYIIRARADNGKDEKIKIELLQEDLPR